MEKAEIQELIQNEVKRQLADEKNKLKTIIGNKLLGTGEFAKAHLIMDATRSWANS